MKRFIAALRFLTVIPLPGRWGTSEDELTGAALYFPVVGVLIGVAAAALSLGVFRILPPLAGSVVLVIALSGISGGLHLDGLADTADGLLGCRSRERALEIMRDSHIGAMGAAAIAAVLMLKAASLSSLSAAVSLRTVFLMPVAGRCALVIMMWLLPYARETGGLGSVFYRRRPVLAGIWAVVLLVVAGWYACGVAGVVAAVASVLVVAVFAAYVYRRIQGATGDTLGAACEMAECAAALTMAGWHFCGRGIA